MGNPQESGRGNQDIKRFKFRGEPPLEGVTPTLLADLHDIVTKWGKLDPEKQIVTYRSGSMEGMEFELYIRIAMGTDRDSWIISKGLASNLEGRPTRNGFVHWDVNLSAQEARNAVSSIDKKAREKGLIDPTGMRRSLKPEDSLLHQDELPSHAVRIDFYKKGTMILLSKDVDPREALKMYDQPGLLATVNLPLVGTVICRKEDEDHIRLSGVITREVLKDRGINTDDLSGLDGMPEDYIDEIQAEVDRRLRKYKGNKQA